MSDFPDYTPERLAPLRDAYSALHEEQKRRLSQSAAKCDPLLWRNWFCASDLHGGFREGAAAERPTGTGKKLDDAILKSVHSSVFLPAVFSSFLINNRAAWIEQVLAHLVGADKSTISARLEQAIASVAERHGSDPFWPLFAARAKLAPEELLQMLTTIEPRAEEPSAVEGENSPLPAKAAANADAPAHPEPKGRFSEIRDRASTLERVLDYSRQAKPFDKEEAIGALESLSLLGAEAREQAELLSRQLGRELPEWTSLEQLESHIRDLETAATAAGEVARLRRYLEVVQISLNAVTGYAIRTAVRRERADTQRKYAVAELAEAAQRPSPPRLPLADRADAADWVKAIMTLDNAPFEEVLAELQTAAFNALAAFFTEVESWSHLEFAPAASSASGPAAEEKIAEAPGKTLEPALANAPITLPAAAAVLQAAPPSPLAQKPSAAETSKLKSAPVPAQKKPPSKAEAPLTDTRPPAPADEDLAVQLHGATIKKFIESGRAILAADYVAALPPAISSLLPHPALLRVLAVQPYLYEPGTEAAELTRADLLVLAQNPPKNDLERMLWWSAMTVPAFVDSNSTAAGLLAQAGGASLPQPLQDLTHRFFTFLKDVKHCSPEVIRQGSAHALWATNFEQAQADVRSFKTRAQTQTFSYQRASRIWHHLNRDGVHAELADLLLDPVAAGRADKIKQIVKRLENERSFRRIIDDTTRAIFPGHFEPIIASAFVQLRNRTDDLLCLAREFETLLECEPQQGDFIAKQIELLRAHALPVLRVAPESLRAQRSGAKLPLDCVACEAAIDATKKLENLIDGSLDWPTQAHQVGQIFELVRLRVDGLRVEQSGSVGGEPEARLKALSAAALGEERSLRESVEFRTKVGDLRGARKLMDVLRSRLSEQEVAILGQDIAEREQAWRGKLRAGINEARTKLSNARIFGILPEADSRELRDRLVQIESNLEQTQEFGSLAGSIEVITANLREETRKAEQRLEVEIAGAAFSKDNKDRLVQLLGNGDLLTVREYFTRLKSGYDLPAPERRIVLSGFNGARQEGLISALKASNGLDALLAAARTGGKFAGQDFSAHSQQERQDATDWLQAWQRLRVPGQPKEPDIRAVLSGLGYAIRKMDIAMRGAQWSTNIEVDPTSDRDLCPVPQFGSSSRGLLSLLHVYDRAAPELLVHRAQGTAQAGALIVFYMAELPVESRAAVARLCREKQRAFLVLDDLLVAHLTGIRGQRLGSFVRAATPYTWLDPFVPSSSLVPPEMFFGRQAALDALLDQNQQRCFVYGGRQLGKTALLREVERRFHDPANHQYAMWVDLLAHGFGVDTEPAQIWETLTPLFKAFSGFQEAWSKTQGRSNHLEAAVGNWLQAEPRRRILLLLDESDRFLDRDAVNDFSQSRVLKGLMDRTERRFKVVFAGLHNVQRTIMQSNHPLAHLGTPINVGAYTENGEWFEAYKLITEPLAALGFEFSSPDLPSRILTQCNFYPGLIQQFGCRLLQRFRARPALRPPFIINEADIEAISGDEQFRSFMLERFRWTLQLDPRYHYLAYSHAMSFHVEPERFTVGYLPSEIKARVEEYWPEKFSSLSLTELTSLLDEMQGLGIFIRDQASGRYTLRNTNVLLLLGNPDTILEELTSERMRQPIEYRSETFRGTIGIHGSGSRDRRVLTRAEEGMLANRHGTTLVTGSNALELPLLQQSLERAFGAGAVSTARSKNDVEFSDLLERQREGIKEEGTHIVFVGADARWTQAWLDSARRFCDGLASKKRFIRVVFSVSPELLLGTHASLWGGASPEREVRLMLRKWSDSFIGPWLAESTQRATGPLQDLRLVTGRWPTLLKLFCGHLEKSGDWRLAISAASDDISARLSDPNAFHEFLGAAPTSRALFDSLREIRDLTGARFSTQDLAECGEILKAERKIEPAYLSRSLDAAEVLQVLGRTSADNYEWDPIFERLLTRK